MQSEDDAEVVTELDDDVDVVGLVLMMMLMLS